MPPAEVGPVEASRPLAGKPSGLLRRCCAAAYESLLLAALLLIAGFAALPLIGPAPGRAGHAVSQLYLLPWPSRAFLFLFYFVVAGAYCIVCWSNGRRTLPMKTWGLAIVARDGSPVAVRRAIERYFAAWISPATALAGYVLAGRWGLAAGLLSFVWAAVDPERQFLHDRLAGTRVIVRR